MQKITIKLAAFIIITSFLTACGGNQDEKIEEVTEVITATDSTNQVDYILPSPLQIAELFKSAGLTYIGDITSPKTKVETFNSKNDQKLNFGVYSADMAYCIMNNQTQESINYLNTLRLLSEKLWMTDILSSMGISTRLEANIGNEDSLTYIMADLQMQLDDYLDENGMGYTGSIIFAGAWVETMYLGSKVNESKQNDKLISRLSEQAVILNSLIKSVKQSDEENEFTELITDLENIQKHFSRFDEESSENYVMNKEEINALTTDITNLRNKIIGDKSK
ncbi:MAG: hypothetical protein COX70_02390 [Flavobacteriales bacterium CG_4_10_14_0_2_um_filter_32_8]|nr:MAG: hypothetical protein COX70_02390 [Flavobacteriales bacterium CG_4_10_14_0_2_um_filter_32_8]PJB15207.1 MAG: hypothetical protein CO118_04590 [Flavobacteriales bacterium CG_4_9_14_3_um_filter_32_8]